MKTNNLRKNSFLTKLILLSTLAFNGMINNLKFAKDNDPATTQRMVGIYTYGGFRARNLQAIYNPPRSKFKGYMRENRRSTFNKNR